MQSLYFTRHGETVWNVENKICGVTDIPLTDKGRAQARALGRRLAAEPTGITRILCSPLIRASETARLIAAETGLPPRQTALFWPVYISRMTWPSQRHIRSPA